METGSPASVCKELVDGFVSVIEELGRRLGLITLELAGQMGQKIIILAREKVNPVDPGGPVIFAKEVGQPVVRQFASLEVPVEITHLMEIADYLGKPLFIEACSAGELGNATWLERLDMVGQVIL